MHQTLQFIIFLLFPFVSFFAQQDTIPLGKKIVFDFGFRSGIVGEPIHYGEIEDFQLLTNGSSISSRNFDDFYMNYPIVTQTNVIHFFQVGMTPTKSPKINWRFGLGMTNPSGLYLKLINNKKVPFDTLNVGGEQTILDSTYSEYIDYVYETRQVRFDFSWLYRTDLTDRVHFFFGFSASYGLSYRSETEVSYSLYTSRSDGTKNSSRSLVDSQNETVRNGKGHVAQIGIPIGADLRLGNKKNFFKQSFLFLELRPSFNMLFIPELKAYDNFQITGALGLKYQLQ